MLTEVVNDEDPRSQSTDMNNAKISEVRNLLKSG